MAGELEMRFISTNRETRFVVLFAAALVLVTSIPYLAGYFLPFQFSRFASNLVGEGDPNAYFAFMRQAAEDRWLFYNPFTPEPHRPVFFNLEWLCFGKLAAIMGISLEAAFQVERIIFTFILCFLFTWLSSFLFDTVLMRRLVLIMVMLGGGFGWLFVILGYPPQLPYPFVLDMHGGFHPFSWILVSPHPLVAQSLALLTLCFFLHAEASGKRKNHVFAALCGVLLASIRPYDTVYLIMALSLYILILFVIRERDRSIARIALRGIVVLAPFPVMIYYYYLLKIHPVFRWWSIQALGPPPSLDALAATLGISTILLISGLWSLRNLTKGTAPQILVTCCLVSSLIFLYSYPMMKFSIQFSSTVLIPAILAGTMKMEKKLISAVRSHKWTTLGLGVMLLVNSLTSVYLVGHHTKEAVEGRYRIHDGLLAAYSWLDENSEPRDIVLPSASYPTGNQIPRYTHTTVFSGYHFNTVKFEKKDEMVWRFFLAETPDSFRYELLREFGIRYVFLRSLDRMHITYNPNKSPFLKEIFRNNQATIYEFMP
jgi:hypothetical protein